MLSHWHRRVEKVEDLGRGSIQELVTWAAASSNGHAPQLAVHSAAALAAGVHASSAVGAVNPASALNDALACLSKAPVLADLQLWTSWDVLFRPLLGPLAKFLQTEGG